MIPLAAGAALLLLRPYWRLRRTGDRAGWYTALGQRLAQLCERCGPAAIKAAQIVASRSDLLPHELTCALARVQDRARPPSSRALRRALVAAYGPAPGWPFALVSSHPAAAGSVAAVVHARLPDGEQVAIKLVRPGVTRQVAADLVSLAWLLRILERSRRFAAVPLCETFARLAPVIARQCDMLEEGRARDRLGASLAGGVIMPRIRADLTRPAALAMEWRPGACRLTDPQVPQADYEAGCKALLRSLYRMIFVNGFVHCDLHPGNLAWEPVGTVVLYDFGLVAELSRPERKLLADLFVAIVERDANLAAAVILESATIKPAGLDRAALEADAGRLLDRWAGKRAGEFLIAAFVIDLFELQHRHGIRGTPGFVAAIWALATFEGLVRERFPSLDFQAAARPFLLSAMLNVWRARGAPQPQRPQEPILGEPLHDGLAAGVGQSSDSVSDQP
jgi:ubiquinone biosynthesis protein